MSNSNPTTPPLWKANAVADQLGWADPETGEVLIPLAPNAVDVNFLNAKERAQSIAWMEGGFLTAPEAGLTGAIESVTITNHGDSYIAPPTVTVNGDGTAGDLTAVMGTVGKVISVAINAAGADYVVGSEFLLPDGVGGVGALISVDSVDGTGGITAVTLLNSGKEYAADITDIPTIKILDATVGTGATLDLTVGYPITDILITVAGVDYNPTNTTLDITGSAEAVVGIANVGTGDFGTMEALAASRM